MKPAIAVLLLSTPALADGTATWLWDVTTQDGDAIVEPGETASVTLALLMEPDTGDVLETYIGWTTFDTLGGVNAAKGHIVGWEVLNCLDCLLGDLTTSDGVSLYGTTAGQLLSFGGFFTADNPVDVFTFEWAPYQPGSYDVAYTTSSQLDDPHTVSVIEWHGGEDVDFIVYPVTEAAITFTVVPTPPTLLLFTIFTLPRHRSAPSAPPR